MPQDLEILVLELNIFKTLWLIIGTNKSPSLNDMTLTSEIKNVLMLYRSSYDNFLLMGDFNMTPESPKMK